MKFDSVKILTLYILLLIYFLNYLLHEYFCSSLKVNIFLSSKNRRQSRRVRVQGVYFLFILQPNRHRMIEAR